LQNIVKNYKVLYKNAQGHTQFLNESGFLKMIMKGDQKIMDDVLTWITNDVLPSIRKYGEYKASTELKQQLDEANKLLEEKDEQIKILEHNMKNAKHKQGGVIYIMRPIVNTLKLNLDEEIYIKCGYAKDMNKREAVYNTCVKNKIQVIKKIYVNDPKNIEHCVNIKMSVYRIKERKEYYKCSYSQIVNIIASCVLFYENETIDVTQDIELNRTTNDNLFDKDKIVAVKFLTDDDDLCNGLNSDSDSDSIDSSLDESKNQLGGGDYYYCKFLILNQKYLQLKYDLL
jgi:hypothetical protein